MHGDIQGYGWSINIGNIPVLAGVIPLKHDVMIVDIFSNRSSNVVMAVIDSKDFNFRKGFIVDLSRGAVDKVYISSRRARLGYNWLVLYIDVSGRVRKTGLEWNFNGVM